MGLLAAGDELVLRDYAWCLYCVHGVVGTHRDR